jgi:hypothetical protein
MLVSIDQVVPQVENVTFAQAKSQARLPQRHCGFAAFATASGEVDETAPTVGLQHVRP